jgi:serine/threonine protein kinase
MKSDHRQSAEELFTSALDLSVQARAAFLDDACKDAPDVRRVVDELLLNHQRLGSFLDHPLLADTDLSAAGGFTAGGVVGRYSIIEQLGAGGMGVVYRAHDEVLKRLVAIKTLAPGTLTGEKARHQFRKEALALAKLSHPSIATVFDVGQVRNIDYIVMECVAGEGLDARLQAGPLTVKEATSICLQIAEAMQEAHEHGVIHRDLKPANVMLTQKGHVKVLDFGLARLFAPETIDATVSLSETQGPIGTPRYMPPEQIAGGVTDPRSDVWSLGVIYYECLTGKVPFQRDNTLSTLHAISSEEFPQVRQLRPGTPALADEIVQRALRKDPAERYQSAAEFHRVAAQLMESLTATEEDSTRSIIRLPRLLVLAATMMLLILIGLGAWLFHRWSSRRWVREEAIPQIARLIEQKRPLAAFLLLRKAQGYMPGDPQLEQIAAKNTEAASITSSPPGATVEIEDYDAPASPWYGLGTTPLQNIRIPQGYFRWKVSAPAQQAFLSAPPTNQEMHFAFDELRKAPSGMVPVPAGRWGGYVSPVGWVGPYQLPAYYIDQYEVTNLEYQKFVDSGGYNEETYWREAINENGHTLSWSDAMARLRDTTGRPGPSTWVAGHYPEGQANYPVTGVSWFEAAAYAAYARKSLPTFAQWYKAANMESARYTMPVSNISGKAMAPVGAFQGLGMFGTYDMAGNAREWVINASNDGTRMILGGDWKSPGYLYTMPEALFPFDRSAMNGFRCVRNLTPQPAATEGPVRHLARDLSQFKPASDAIFAAYKLLYRYPESPLNVKEEGVVAETADWREEKVTFDDAYDGERMAAYLFLPKNVRPPYQTILFFPSARVLYLAGNDNGRALGDTKFFDYAVQSGRAVMYPIYQGTYERRVKFYLPDGSESIELIAQWYKDAARSLDYLATRPDIDNTKLAYMGVSMGSAEGVVFSTLLQNRLKTVILLDGGFFLEPPPPGDDQADFAPHLKLPVLMVNGRYDFTFPVETAQDPLFKMLGTPPAQKEHVVLDTPHDVTEQHAQLVTVVLDWLDRYLGRVH